MTLPNPIAKEANMTDEQIEPDEIVWLRDLDGTGSMHVCTPHCPGAVKYVRADLTVWSMLEEDGQRD